MAEELGTKVLLGNVFTRNPALYSYGTRGKSMNMRSGAKWQDQVEPGHRTSPRFHSKCGLGACEEACEDQRLRDRNSGSSLLLHTPSLAGVQVLLGVCLQTWLLGTGTKNPALQGLPGGRILEIKAPSWKSTLGWWPSVKINGQQREGGKEASGATLEVVVHI